MHGNAHLFPDSRLKDQSKLAQMVDWPMPDGTTRRVEAIPIFCANCGKALYMVPKDNTAFAFAQCRKCFEKFPPPEGYFAQPDDEFCRSVQYEMEQRFGRHLTELELAAAAEQGQLGKALELLEKESPYPVMHG